MRLLALSIGNTSLFGGVFHGAKLGRIFRAQPPLSSAIRGPFDQAVFCSVVPELTPAIARDLAQRCPAPPLILTVDAPHGLPIAYQTPHTLGTDRLAAALGARALFPDRHVITVDCGTATTVTVLHRRDGLLGGAIMPGLALWPEMLATRTAQLPLVQLQRPRSALGRSTRAGLASGIFHGHAGAIRELVARVRRDAFGRASALVIGTGGHAARFATEKLFDTIEPALVLHGLRAFAAQRFPL